jgi:hypothetical protein
MRAISSHARLTLRDRADAYARAFPDFPASHLQIVQEQGRDVLYGIWLLGNDYRTRSTLYGAYPRGYLDRVMALFPDAGDAILHAFSGALPPGPYSRVDVVDRRGVPDARFHQVDVCALAAYPEWTGRFALVCADPPYSDADADRYGTRMVDRRRAMAALARVTAPGRFLVWLDCVWPMHRKDTWQTVGRVLLDELVDDVPLAEDAMPEDSWQVAGRIGLVRSTNHRVRLVSIFERRTA